MTTNLTHQARIEQAIDTIRQQNYIVWPPYTPDRQLHNTVALQPAIDLMMRATVDQLNRSSGGIPVRYHASTSLAYDPTSSEAWYELVNKIDQASTESRF